ncbi:ATP-binding protein [Lactobacillus selangorensis]|uniref:ATP-binding protein n=1 Tax=Lactobacillus selangorensis TaxID=81857 RepID=A0A0R2FK12_9LACO|nr:ATP-dependent Clp protease ATP-binding subunit [Lactobacillus selangorensis]KRN28977.1 ATP-binding protein [Lactobacillus selangorensis]KRN32613.1 ATP-binding protein [Lactobacillus selangorensis]
MANDPFGFDDFDDLFNQLGGFNDNPNIRRSINGVPIDSARQAQAAQAAQQQQQAQNGQQQSILQQFGVDVTKEAEDGKLDPVIGRDDEIKQAIEVLNRRTKNNPVLIGEAGVGKTAVVEGLAQKIVNSDVPQKLIGKRIIRLDVVSLVQDTGIRGQFEKRLQDLLKELKDNPDIILFIDEIHEIMGAGDAEGGMDAGNVLKPALARGDIQLIGATTLNEYRQIEKDPALARRFQPVMVNEPSAKDTLKILKGLQPKYEEYHHVHYTDGALKACVTLSQRYIQDRFLPDKAIDLMDESGAKKNLTIQPISPENIDKQITELSAKKDQASAEEDFEKAAQYRDQIDKLNQQRQNKIDASQKPEVTARDIANIIEQKTGIPVGDLQEKESHQLEDLEPDLEKEVIGQNQAIQEVSDALIRNRAGFNQSGRPIGSFLFVGPTGVGKTELAKQLAKELFGTEDSMIRIDMSEYQDKSSISKLIGSAPGYIGYEEAGQLTEQVRRHPYSLVLLDEVEKAHPDVMHLFLQILDDGRLTDSQGRVVSFKDTIIIMTSNAGVGPDGKMPDQPLIDTLKNYFKPEFLNRFDGIVEFNPLTKDDLIQIVNLMLDNVNKMVQNKGIRIDVTKPAKDKLVEMGYEPTLGARPLRRVIQNQIETPVARYILKHPDVKTIQMGVKGDKIVVEDKAAKDDSKSDSDLPETEKPDSSKETELGD